MLSRLHHSQSSLAHANQAKPASQLGQVGIGYRPCHCSGCNAADVQLTTVTLDTDTTVHTLYGKQFGARKSYNPKNRGKKSYPPILTFLAETREFIAGQLRNGDRPTGTQIAAHLRSVFQSLPAVVAQSFARADSGFYCWDAVQAYEEIRCQFILVVRKTSRLVEQLRLAAWRPSPKTDADEECEFWYQPEGWARACRFLAYRPSRKVVVTWW